MSFISFLEKNLLGCPWKQQLDIECMGCGIQRALIHILKGEFIEAFYMYPAIYSLILMFSFLILHLKFDFNNGSKILVYLFSLNAIIIIISFILKTIN